MQEVSRRTFVAEGALLGIGAACAPMAATALAQESVEAGAASYTPACAVEADVVIVGAGNSGLAASVEAAQQGLSVVLVESAETLGGTLMATEVIFGLGSALQAEQGIVPPMKYEVVREELEYTNYRSDSLRWGDLVDHSGEDIDWLQAQGVPFAQVDDYLGVSAFDTAHWWEGSSGIVCAMAMAAKVEELGVQVMTQATALDLIMDGSAVRGVYVQESGGDVVQIDAAAVILATGGLGGNLDLLQEKCGIDLSHASWAFPLVNGSGDGLRMALATGAKETPINLLLTLGVDGFDIRNQITCASCLQPCLYVNGNGERFMSEDLYLKRLYALVANAYNSQPGGAYTILDQNYLDLLATQGCYAGILETKPGDTLPDVRPELEEGLAVEGHRVVFKGETLEELAADMGADPELLVATVQRYNELCEKGVDEDFGKDPTYLTPVTSSPFYAVHSDISVLSSIGGVHTNRSMQVCDSDDVPIDGLYFAGVGGCELYQETYNYQISGGMNAYATYSGRTASQHAAKMLA